MSAARDYERRLWVESLMLRGDWSYPEALAWIIFRDPEAVAFDLDYGTSTLYKDSVSFVEGVFNRRALEVESEDLNPAGALHNALLAGKVLAHGRYHLGGIWKPHARDWQYLQFFNPYMSRGSDNVMDRRDYRGGLGSCATMVMLDRESMVATFKPVEAATPKGKVAARRDLVKLCRAFFHDGKGSVPIGARWREHAVASFEISDTAAKAVWSSVAAEWPGLSSKKKPKGPKTVPKG